MEMLCIMHEAAPRGSLLINGRPVTEQQMAMLTGAAREEVSGLLAELEAAGVFSRDDDGVIYSRRIRRDDEKAARDKSNGRMGGNPDLKGGVNPEDKAQKPEARDQKLDKEKEPRAGRADKSDWPKDFEDQFWQAFPRKTKKGASLRKLDAIRRSEKVPWSVLLPAVKLYAGSVSGKDPQFVMHPLTWLNAGCWDDELPAPTQVFSGPVDAPGLVHVMRESEDWPIWAERYRKHKGMDPPTDVRGGWSFKAEWASDTTTEAAA